MILEACTENFPESFAAQMAGANRIELCDNLVVGGTTPSFGTIKMCLNELKIPIATMIRPRGGDFVYSEQEIRIMKEDIRVCKELGSQGVVFGLLTKDGHIDVKTTRELVELSSPMEAVFHKAFDEVNDPFDALEQLIEAGINRVLTSGTKTTALEGKEILRKLIQQAGNRITVLVAGKVTYENLETIKQLIPAREFHGRKIVKMQ